MPRSSQPNYSAPALDKGLDILEVLASTDKAQCIADLARALERTPSEIFRMVGTLEKRGYIVRDTAGSFRLSLKLYQLAHMHSPFDSIIKVAAAPMHRLSDDVRETTALAVLDHGQVVIVAEELSMARVRLSVEVGSKVPALQTVSGRLLLAHLPAGQQETFLKPLPLVKRQKLQEELKMIRRDGYYIAPSHYRTGIDIAVIVGNPETGPAASLAIPCLAGGVNEGKERKVLKAMLACTGEINRALGLSTQTRTHGKAS
jgi:DNA-binding IclR family transcriptional regulator